MDFNVIKAAVAKQFDRMQQYPLFRTCLDKEVLWQTYLNSFPAGSNPVYKERTEHDCQCCKQFVRTVGNVVAVVDGSVVSIWDVDVKDANYNAVAKAMSEAVKREPITDVFLHYEKSAGTDKTLQQVLDGVKTWTHFFVNIKQPVVNKADVGTRMAEARSSRDVLFRSMSEITSESVDVVLDLISQNSLYRGQENEFAVSAFKALKRKFCALKTDGERNTLAWVESLVAPQSVSRIRNTAIGTLLVDLSEGKNIEDAVGSFEAKVAPMNYKRPTALITKAMVEKAQKTIAELGLTSALDRRYATVRDVNVNDILFADRKTKRAMDGDVFDSISEGLPDKMKGYDKVEEVGIDRFVSDILPRAESLEIMFENRHIGNLVSLIAPVDHTAGRLFKWYNNFCWAYNGDVADSIRERVKRAGGNVTGDLCCRLAWYNFDDLDLHMVEPDGTHIFYSNKHPHGTTGQLDVDMNAGEGSTRAAVENIFYPSKARIKQGRYSLRVNQFCKRESTDVGFEVELDFTGTVHRFVYDKAVQDRLTISVVEFEYTHAGGLKIISSLPESSASKSVWNVQTQAFQRVNMLMLSPNYWNGSIGNKHYFFMLDGCRNEGSARGFFNEFLSSELEQHRKVFEIVGAKMKATESDEQLSGVGFSSTQKNSVLCRVRGSFSRVIKIVF